MASNGDGIHLHNKQIALVSPLFAFNEFSREASHFCQVKASSTFQHAVQTFERVGYSEPDGVFALEIH